VSPSPIRSSVAEACWLGLGAVSREKNVAPTQRMNAAAPISSHLIKGRAQVRSAFQQRLAMLAQRDPHLREGHSVHRWMSTSRHPGHLPPGYTGPWLITAGMGVPNAQAKSQDGWLEIAAANQIHAAVQRVFQSPAFTGDALQQTRARAGQDSTRRSRSTDRLLPITGHEPNARHIAGAVLLAVAISLILGA